jgi:peptidylprolyl isomerase
LDNTLIIELASGKVTVELRPDLAPLHVERIKELAGQGFYDGIVFHRVIPGFMAQTGDPTGTGRGGSKLPDLKAEFTKTPFERGTLGMARSQSPNSANSQFFICFDRSDWLDGQYTVFGKVVDGMDLVDRLAKGEPPAKPDKMLKVYLASAAPAAK